MRTATNAVMFLCIATLSACASSSSGSTTTTRPTTQTIGRGTSAATGGTATGTLNMVVATATADVSHLTFTPDAVWRILPSVYDSVGITVSTLDQARKSIGNPGYKIRTRLGKVALSKYLDCGNGTTQVGQNADNYDVILTVMSTVSPEGASGSVLSTTVEAQARPVIVRQDYSRCSSKGGIEMRIADLVKARLMK